MQPEVITAINKVIEAEDEEEGEQISDDATPIE